MRIERREIETAPLVQAERVEELGPERVRGALVKLVPRVTRPERAALDVVGMRARVLAMGARGVVVTPEVQMEPEPREPTERDADARQELRQYVMLHASGPEVRKIALALMDDVLPAV